MTAGTGHPIHARGPGRPARTRRRLRVGGLLLGVYLVTVMFGGCADTLLLYPTTGRIEAAGTTRVEVPVPGRPPIEVYTRRPTTTAGGEPGTRAEPGAYLLVLDGNGGRAEHAVFWGDDAAGGRAVEVWSPNYPGYGGSAGPARLAGVGPAALAAYDALCRRAAGKPVVIWGASLGSTAALHVAARRPVAGLILTNPPPLRQLILQRHGWWNLWLAAVPVALGVPADLDSLANAAAVTVPAVFVAADADAIVPPAYQQLVIDAYAGPKQVVRLPNAGHDTPASEANPTAWRAALEWLWGRVD